MFETRSSRRLMVGRSVASVIAVLLVGVGYASGGIGGAIVMCGIVIFLIGLGAALVGGARWIRIGNRKSAAVVAAAGVAALLVGGVIAGPPASDAGPAEATASPSSAPISSGHAGASTAGVDPASGLLTDAAAERAIAAARPSSALAALGRLDVKGRAPATGYDRSQFGQAWADIDRNGCDTRNDILARDLTGETFRPGTHDCVVLSGTLAEPYSGRTVQFQRGQETSEAVQIDHVVALSDAWQKGAQRLDVSRREAFANDPLNLLAVDGPLNMQKSDGDAATWLPPNRTYRCAYVARQIAVKISYTLWVTKAEQNAMATVLSTCPNEPVPAGGVAATSKKTSTTPRPTPVPGPVPPPTPVPTPTPAPVPAPSADVYYQNCDAVRAAGAAPIRPGDPGWQPKFDGNQDGVGCE
jgi:hypothetical protein